MVSFLNNDDMVLLLAARKVASSSLKANTKVGVVVADDVGNIIITACNGFLDNVKRTAERELAPLKSKFSEHAERRAIYLACRQGVSLIGHTVYSTHFPCCDCARGLIQVGIKRVVIDSLFLEGHFAERWKDDFIYSRELLAEAGVIVAVIELEPIVEAFNLYSSGGPS